MTEPPVDPPVDLLGAVAYGALTAFTRLAADAALAPDLDGRAEMAALAAIEMAHVERIRGHLAGRGVELVPAMAPFAAVLDAFAARTASRDWGEALVGAYVGRTLAVDLVAATGAVGEDDEGEVAELLRGPDAGDVAQRSSTREAGDVAQRSSTSEAGDVAQRSSTREAGDVAQRSSTREAGDVGQRGGDSGFDAFAERAVAALVTDERTRGRLALWGRRLLGETLAAAAEVLDEHPDAAAALLGGTSRASVFKALKSRHSRRMHALGL